MTTQPFTLDKWDIALIRLLKGERLPTSLQLRALWAERNAIDVEFIALSFVVQRMAEIVEGCNPRELASLLADAHPSVAWRYSREQTSDYWETWSRVLGSRLRLTEVVKLPGYREAVEADLITKLREAD